IISIFFFSSRSLHTRFSRDWSSDVCSSDLLNDSLSMANIYSNLAVIQKNNNRFDSAQFYIEKSLLFAPGNLNLVYINQTTLGNKIGRASCRERENLFMYIVSIAVIKRTQQS